MRRRDVVGLGLCVLGAVLIALAAPGCLSTVGPEQTPTYVLHPYQPMFTLTVFAPTATPPARPIPPLPGPPPLATPQPLPRWIEALDPPVLSTVARDSATEVCIRPSSTQLEDCGPLYMLYRGDERARDHLYLAVNGMVPSELTWEQIIIPNSTNPGTAWPGVRTYKAFCWPVELAAGAYEAVLHYPGEEGPASFAWSFVVNE